MNSIQRIGDKYLLNSRHCWSTFLIDSDGNIEWYLDGSDGDNFTLPSPDIFVRPSAVTWRKYCELTLAPKQNGSTMHAFRISLNHPFSFIILTTITPNGK
jgi:hypothetical protein